VPFSETVFRLGFSVLFFCFGEDMTDDELQRGLDRLARLSNKLKAEAQRRYGKDGMLFFEAEGTFHIMDGDAHHRQSCVERQKHIRFSANVISRMDAGAW